MKGVAAVMSAIVATGSLCLTAASLLAAPAGGVVFTPFLFGLFLLALVGVFGGLEGRTVRQHNPVLDGKAWRHGSSGVDGYGELDPDVHARGGGERDRAVPLGRPAADASNRGPSLESRYNAHAPSSGDA
jgi:hypothetical protein